MYLGFPICIFLTFYFHTSKYVKQIVSDFLLPERGELTQAYNTSLTTVFAGIYAEAAKWNNKSLQYVIGVIELVNRHMEGKHL